MSILSIFNKLRGVLGWMAFQLGRLKRCKAHLCSTQTCAVLQVVYRSADVIFLESPIHRPAADTQPAGSFGDIPIGHFQGRPDRFGVITGPDVDSAIGNMGVIPDFGRDMGQLNGLVSTQHKGPFDGVFQLANVARPGIVHKCLQNFIRNAVDVLLITFLKTPQK